MTEIISRAQCSLESLFGQVSDQALKGLAAVIAGARRIMNFGGRGGSSMVALEVENRLFRLGPNAAACNEA